MPTHRSFWLAQTLTALFILTAHGLLSAADSGREQLVAEQIKSELSVGQLVELKTNGGTFIALETKAVPDREKGALLLLHDAGSNPNDPLLMHALRTGLPGHGWTTLAIQLPVVDVDQPLEDQLALIADAGARIEAAQTWLKSGDYATLAFVGHGLGAVMACQVLAKQDAATPWKALVALALLVPETDLPEAHTLEHLKTIPVPILDVFGSRDLAQVTRTAPQREQTAKTAQRSYRQDRITGADHDFTGLHAALMQRVNAWLTKTLQP